MKDDYLSSIWMKDKPMLPRSYFSEEFGNTDSRVT
jgi:hypothetical protein